MLLQWYYPLSLLSLVIMGAALLLAVLIYQVLPLTRKYQLGTLNGMIISLLVAIIGAAALYNSDIRNNKGWLGHQLPHSDAFLLTLQEPLVEKPASWKAIASVKKAYSKEGAQHTDGKLIIYFKKDSLPKGLGYGSQLLVAKPLQPIQHSGNPGAFDYSRYSLFQGITHQVYLVPSDYMVLPQQEVSRLKVFLFESRQAILHILQTYIASDKERGLAQALLIGYKDDLDKNLLRSYANTGVVHVIAISGLHVGLIYWLLLGLTRPLKRKAGRWVRLLVLLAGLWGFGVLAGAGASVMRSVVMFSFLAGAGVLDRRASVFNTLALSALLLLCYQPFWLWDIGFQLSYAAVFSILVFYRPISGLIYFPNKAIAALWKMNAVTLAAQVFTTPLVLYHFHQFPTLFLLTNLLAVPLSSLILLGEILLCALAIVPTAAGLLGRLLTGMIAYMNTYIENMDRVRFALWEGIQVSALQTTLLMAALAAITLYLLHKKKGALPFAFGCAALFLLLRTHSFLQADGQQKLIVYQVPKHRAIDVIEGRQYHFLGDSVVQQDELLRAYHLQPSRILHRVAEVPLANTPRAFTWSDKQVLIIDTTVQLKQEAAVRSVDLLILSGNPKLYMQDLVRTFLPKQIVADASVPRWKAVLWKRDCDSLRIPFHDVSAKGAFVMTL